MADIKETIQQAIAAALQELGVDTAFSTIHLEHPKDTAHGDYATNIALMAFKKVSEVYKTPFDLAQKLVEILNTSYLIPDTCSRIEVAPPGFINFFLSEKYLLSELEHILEKQEKYGHSTENKDKKVVVEYSSPNIAKPFTIGHLRSTIIGDSVANLLEATGWKVYRDNHLGDWGTQFGKQIYAIKTWGDENLLEKSQRPVKELVDLYVKFHEEAEKNPELEDRAREWFQKLEAGDQEARRLWKKCVEWSLKEFERIYDELGVSFTENGGEGYGESYFEDKMEDVIKELEEKKLLKENEGAKLVFFPNDKYPPLMILKKDGATLYSTRDLATDKFRLNHYGQDIVIVNEVGIEQSLYFKQLFETEQMLGWFTKEQRVHIGHGHYRFKEGKMSTRKGNVIWLEDILKEAEKRAEKLAKNTSSLRGGMTKQSHKDTENLAKVVGIGAIRWNDLKRTSQQDIVFDWEDILNMQGNSGPYIQYTFARTQSVIAKSKVKSQKSKVYKEKFEIEELQLLRLLYQFPQVVSQAANTYSPHIICTYLFELAQSFNLFYQKHKIIESEQKEFRLALTAAVGQVLKNGLHLLGISVPQRM